jgi:hypothetical protein
LLPEKVHALENRTGSRRGGLESPSEGGILLLEGSDSLPHSWRIGLVVRIEMTQPLFGGQCPPPEAGELFAHLANERLELAHRFDVRSSVV